MDFDLILILIWFPIWEIEMWSTLLLLQFFRPDGQLICSTSESEEVYYYNDYGAADEPCVEDTNLKMMVIYELMKQN